MILQQQFDVNVVNLPLGSIHLLIVRLILKDLLRLDIRDVEEVRNPPISFIEILLQEDNLNSQFIDVQLGCYFVVVC